MMVNSEMKRMEIYSFRQKRSSIRKINNRITMTQDQQNEKSDWKEAEKSHDDVLLIGLVGFIEVARF